MLVVAGCDHDTHLVIQAPGAHANHKSNTESCPLEKLSIRSEACRSVAKMLAWRLVRIVNLANFLDTPFNLSLFVCLYHLGIILKFLFQIQKECLQI